MDVRELDPAVRTALRGLDSRNAEVVAAHLAAAGGLVDDEPELALQHARAARDRASRIAAVREAVGVTAYHAGDFAEAARELRAYRRMSGDESYRAVIADCKRALGRLDSALRLVSEALAENPDTDELVELRLVEAGARHDLGELSAAALVLETALGGRPTPTDLGQADLGQLRLAIAYADLIEERGDDDLATQWYSAIAAADPDDLTGVSTRFGSGDEEDGDDEDGDDGGAPSLGETAPAGRRGGDLPEEEVLTDPSAAVGGSPAVDVADGPVDDEVVLDDDIEAEVAELLGEVPPTRAPAEFDHSRLFQEAAEGQAPDEGDDQHEPPTT